MPDHVDEIAMAAALLASETSPAQAAQVLRRLADEIEQAQPTKN